MGQCKAITAGDLTSFRVRLKYRKFPAIRVPRMSLADGTLHPDYEANRRHQPPS